MVWRGQLFGSEQDFSFGYCWTAQRMIGYPSHYKKLSMEEIADEMLLIISDRKRIMQKKDLEALKGSQNEHLSYGFKKIGEEVEVRLCFL